MQYQRALNVVTTDAGALAGAAGPLGPGKNIYGGYDTTKDGKPVFAATDPAKAIVYWSRTVARVFINRAATAFLYATAVLSFLGFLSTLSDHTADAVTKRFLCALSVVVNMVAVAHYKIVVKIRSYDFGSAAASTFAERDVTPFKSWNETFGIGIEMAVDAVRHSDWLITLIFLIHKLYALAGKNADGTQRMGDVFETVEGVVFCSVIMILLSVFVRVGTDEVWDITKVAWGCACIVPIVALTAWCASVVIMILILVDIDTAVESNKGTANVELYRSFYLIWIGYPLVSLFSWGSRVALAQCGGKPNGETPEWVSLIKDVCYALLDCWSKGAFAMWTAYAAFNMTFFQATGEPLARA